MRVLYMRDYSAQHLINEKWRTLEAKMVKYYEAHEPTGTFEGATLDILREKIISYYAERECDPWITEIYCYTDEQERKLSENAVKAFNDEVVSAVQRNRDEAGYEQEERDYLRGRL